MKFALLTASACVAIAIAGCGGDSASSSTESTAATAAGPAPTGAPPRAKRGKPEVKVPEGAPPRQLQIKDLAKGDGAEAKSGDQVTVHYVGVNYRSGKQFDASWDRGEPLTFPLGAGMVIKGWDKGVEGMRVGGRRELIIPPGLGYGAAGAGSTIPPNETLVFVVDLLKVE